MSLLQLERRPLTWSIITRLCKLKRGRLGPSVSSTHLTRKRRHQRLLKAVLSAPLSCHDHLGAGKDAMRLTWCITNHGKGSLTRGVCPHVGASKETDAQRDARSNEHPGFRCAAVFSRLLKCSNLHNCSFTWGTGFVVVQPRHAGNTVPSELHATHACIRRFRAFQDRNMSKRKKSCMSREKWPAFFLRSFGAWHPCGAASRARILGLDPIRHVEKLGIQWQTSHALRLFHRHRLAEPQNYSDVPCRSRAPRTLGGPGATLFPAFITWSRELHDIYYTLATADRTASHVEDLFLQMQSGYNCDETPIYASAGETFRSSRREGRDELDIVGHDSLNPTGVCRAMLWFHIRFPSRLQPPSYSASFAMIWYKVPVTFAAPRRVRWSIQSLALSITRPESMAHKTL